jgi:hypothetical protein
VNFCAGQTVATLPLFPACGFAFAVVIEPGTSH